MPATIRQNKSTSAAEDRSSDQLPGRGNRVRVALLTNENPPYRIPLYTALGATAGWDFQVFTCIDREYDRLWEVSNEVGFETKRSYSLQYYRNQKVGGSSRLRPVHIPLGTLPDLLRFRPDVVISDEFGARTLLATISAKLTGHRLIVYSEGTQHTEQHIGRAQSLLRHVLNPRIDSYICNGIQSREYLEELRVDSETIFEIGQALDIDTFEYSDRQRDRQSQRERMGLTGLCYLYVGHLVSLKGVKQLIQAWKTFSASEGKDATLLLAGEGQDRQALEKQIAESGLSNVRLLGFVPRDTLKHLFPAADVFVFPTLQDCFSLAFEEAMAASLPVIGSIYGGESELVEEGLNGWVCDPLSPTDLAEKLKLAWTFRDILPAMGQRARDSVSKMNIPQVADRIREAVHLTLAGGKR